MVVVVIVVVVIVIVIVVVVVVMVVAVVVVVWRLVLSAWAGLTFLVVVCRVWCLALWSQLAWLSLLSFVLCR